MPIVITTEIYVINSIKKASEYEKAFSCDGSILPFSTRIEDIFSLIPKCLLI